MRIPLMVDCRPYGLNNNIATDACSGLKRDYLEGLARVEGFVCVVLNLHTKLL